MTVSVLVPYRPDGGWRDRAWNSIRPYWETMDGVELIVESPGPGDHPGQFNHPAAINAAAARASGDVYVVADADVQFSPEWIREATGLVRDGLAAWVLPARYDKLSKAATERMLNHQVDRPLTDEDVEDSTPYSWAGLVVVPARGFHAVGGYDERFSWWGADDVAFGVTFDTLWGRHTRLPGRALHLWHPTPIAHNYGHQEHERQDALMRRYVDAAGDVDAIRAVRFEAIAA